MGVDECIPALFALIIIFNFALAQLVFLNAFCRNKCGVLISCWFISAAQSMCVCMYVCVLYGVCA